MGDDDDPEALEVLERLVTSAAKLTTPCTRSLHRRREHTSPSRDVFAQHTIDEGADIDSASPQRASTSREALEQWGPGA